MQAAGLNRAILASRGDVIARQDGHAEWAPDHLRRSVALLRSTGADNVGGRQEAVGDGPSGRAIARAMSSPFGVGGARFRYSEREAEMPTVFLGTFRRSAFERVGLFDEAYPPHEDYELNERIRSDGWTHRLQPRHPDAVPRPQRARGAGPAVLPIRARKGARRSRQPRGHPPLSPGAPALVASLPVMAAMVVDRAGPPPCPGRRRRVRRRLPRSPASRRAAANRSRCARAFPPPSR